MKLLLHTNAPWSASGYGPQAAMLAPRLAHTHEVGISAFQGLTGSPFDFGSLRVYPGSGAGWGNEILRPHAERHFGADPGLVITLVYVFVLEPATFAGLNVACWTPVDHDPAPPAVRAFFETTGAIPIAMSRFGADRLQELDPLYIPHGVATEVFTPQDRGEARGGAAGRRVRGRDRRRQQGRAVAQVAGRDDRGVRALPRAPRRRAAVSPHRAVRAAVRDAPAVAHRGPRTGRARRGRRRPVPLPLRAVRARGHGVHLRDLRRAVERVDGRRLRTRRARSPSLRRGARSPSCGRRSGGRRAPARGRGATVPRAHDVVCAHRRATARRTLELLRRSPLWADAHPYLAADAPSEQWRDGCWRYLSYPATFEGEAATAVFALYLGRSRNADGVAFVAEDEQRVLGQIKGRK